MEQTYSSLSGLDQDLLKELRHIIDERMDVPTEFLSRLVEDTETRSRAAKSIDLRAEQDRCEASSARVPDLDIKFVMRQRKSFEETTKRLADREAHLQSLTSLPPDIDHVLLENDRMQRRLEQLSQQRRDVFRSIRHH